ANVQALLIVNFFGADQARGIAGSRGGDGGIKGMLEGIAETDSRLSRFHGVGRRSAFEHAGLGSHVESRFYTECARGTKGEKKKTDRREPVRLMGSRILVSYFLPAAAGMLAYFFWKRSTRPAVSMSFCLPVKNGWQLEQISTRSISPLTVERVCQLLPQ